MILFFACCGNSARKSEGTTDGKISATPFEYHESFRLSEHSSESPAITFDISMLVIGTNDSTATENINQAIAYTLFQSDKSSIKEACRDFVEQRRKEYAELLPDYINSRDSGMPEAWFNNYYNAACEIEQGYKGCINYTVMWEEYTGGAHPSSFYTVLNFNPETGEEMVLSDIFKKENFEEALTAKLIENLARQLQVEGIEGIREKGYLYQDTGMFISNNFILGNEKITFIYNKYEIAPYAMGDITIDIAYSEIKDLMK